MIKTCPSGVRNHISLLDFSSLNNCSKLDGCTDCGSWIQANQLRGPNLIRWLTLCHTIPLATCALLVCFRNSSFTYRDTDFVSLDGRMEQQQTGHFSCICHCQHIDSVVLPGDKARSNEYSIDILSFNTHRVQDFCWYWSVGFLTQCISCIFP